MYNLCVISDTPASAQGLRRNLRGLFNVDFFRPDDIRGIEPGRFTVVDINLNQVAHLLEAKKWLQAKPKDGRVIFVTDKVSRISDARAFAIGATAVLHRPIDAKALVTALCGDFSTLAGDPSKFAGEKEPGLCAAVGALENIFSAAYAGGPVDSAAIGAAGGAVVSYVETLGLSAWIDSVRLHHSQTYQHCLLVTGLATAFGQHLGASHADRQRLSTAGMLHDIGKARIPVSILEKPGPLDKDELAIMRKHPEFGLEALETASGLHPEIADIVLHHHEYLDGSGYPHGIQGGEISDIVRVMTICDIFGALIERRSYKPPMDGEKAYQILLDMGPKLEQVLVREFSFATALR